MKVLLTNSSPEKEKLSFEISKIMEEFDEKVDSHMYMVIYTVIQDEVAVSRFSAHDQRQKIWYILEKGLVMPEYMVEITYSSDKILFGNDETLPKSSNCLPDSLLKEIRKCEISSFIPAIDSFLNYFSLEKGSKEVFTATTKGYYSLRDNSEIKGIPNTVKYLKASTIQLSDISPFKEFKNLEYLDLSNNNISDESQFSDITCWPNIKWINLQGNPVRFSREKSCVECLYNFKYEKENPEISDEKLFSLSGFGYRPMVLLSDPDWKLKVSTLNLRKCGISNFSVLDEFLNLKNLNLSKNRIYSLAGVEKFTELEELDCSGNKISSLIIVFPSKIKRLHLGNNLISSFGTIGNIESLMMLSLEENEISSLESFSSLPVLLEIYLASNNISDQKNLNFLKSFPRLMILDIWGNPMTTDSNYRVYTLFQLPKLKVLDGVGVDGNEVLVAKELFTGRLTEEILLSRLDGKNPLDIRELRLNGCGLRDFEDVFNETLFPFLEVLDLSENELCSMQCFCKLPKLTSLDVSKNKIEFLAVSETSKPNKREMFAFHRLNYLNISSNCLKELFTGGALLPNLQEFICTKNELTKIERIDFFPSLRILDLSKNKIRATEFTLFTEEMELTSIRMDDNALKNLPFIYRLKGLKFFYAANNRISDLGDVDRFLELQELREFDLSNNPVNRRPGYRFNLIKRLPNIEFIDQKELTEDEKEQLYIQMMMAQGTLPQPQTNNVPPQILSQMIKGPIKVNSLNFEGLPNIRLQNDYYAFKK